MIPAHMLEGNIERVVETVMKKLGDFPPTDEADAIPSLEARVTMTDLCGHVAAALRGLEMHGGDRASYIRPEPKQNPTLDVRR